MIAGGSGGGRVPREGRQRPVHLRGVRGRGPRGQSRVPVGHPRTPSPHSSVLGGGSSATITCYTLNPGHCPWPPRDWLTRLGIYYLTPSSGFALIRWPS